MVLAGAGAYSLVHTLLLQDVSSSHNAQRDRETDRQTDRRYYHAMRIL